MRFAIRDYEIVSGDVYLIEPRMIQQHRIEGARFEYGWWIDVDSLEQLVQIAKGETFEIGIYDGVPTLVFTAYIKDE